MKKRLSLVFASITIASVCSFVLTGKIIQKNYYDTVERLNSQGNLKVSLIKYKRGLFNSTADLELEHKGNKYPLQQTITHGPVIAAKTPNGVELKLLAAQLQTNFASPMREKINSYFNNEQAYLLVSLIDFSNHVKTWFKLKPIDQTSANQLHVSANDFFAEFDHDLNFNRYSSNISVNNIDINNRFWQLSLNKLAINSVSNTNVTGFENDVQLKAGSLSFSKHGNALLSLNDVNTELRLKKQDSKYSVDLRTNIENSQILQQKFAQDEFRFKANNINQDSLGLLPQLREINPLASLLLAQQVTSQSTDLELHVPKYFSEALVSYLSYEIYRSTEFGMNDRRDEAEILKDINNNISKLVQSALKQNIFVDNGTQYALNTATN